MSENFYIEIKGRKIYFSFRFQVPGSRSENLKHGTWNMEPGLISGFFFKKYGMFVNAIIIICY